ncbi:MAG: DUF3291 domain-containing protein [Anaerolineae bacterium]|nr:DUF3291 domain-containing protein [Anaerolineae bacterium]
MSLTKRCTRRCRRCTRRQGEFPAYVIWWVADGHIPDWHEAYERHEHHEHLHQHGATAFAFDFKHPFDAEGYPTQVDRPAAKAIAQSFTRESEPSQGEH